MTKEEINSNMRGIKSYADEILANHPTTIEKMLCEAIVNLTKTVRELNK